MVVIPTSFTVALTYGQTTATRLGSTITWITVFFGATTLWGVLRRRRNRAK
jgi:hypothetical protein